MHEQDNERYDEPPSKSQRRRDMEALQALGEELVGLPATALRNIPMPDT
ncbi:MAG TPA: DUF615 domain-containing protein, partial [Gammaproteobacteria bacterium]|nr:DUF615 domain-containing protein [Gammaproteobacteria bacterium]